MANGRDDRYEGQDEGEYHFSDDQSMYDLDAETIKATPSGSAAGGLTQFRRPLIGVVVFGVLVFVIYKMLAPTNVTQPTDIASPTLTTTTPAPKKQLKVQTPADEAAKQQAAMQAQQQQAQQQVAAQQAAAQPAQPPVAQTTAAPVATPEQAVAPQTPQPPAQAVQQPAAPQQPPAIPLPQAMTPSAPAPAQAQSQPQPQQTAQPITAQQPPAATPAPMQPAPEAMQQAPLVVQPGAPAEEQEQNTQLRDQVQELNSRISTLERNINRLMTALGGRGASAEYGTPQQQQQAMQGQPMMPPAPVPEVPKVARAPKIAYTVQAIIPGRAWLKSDSGDTITVAEGDKLRGVGRISKIDPYDGVVEIDTGSQVVALSYGFNGD